jgi:uncharacterized membrane protein
MKPVDRFSELLLLTIISLGIVIVVMLIGLFGYILVRKIIEKKRNKRDDKPEE